MPRPPHVVTWTATQSGLMTLTCDFLRSARMPVMRVEVIHPYSKYQVRRPSRSEYMADFRSQRQAAW